MLMLLAPLAYWFCSCVSLTSVTGCQLALGSFMTVVTRQLECMMLACTCHLAMQISDNEFIILGRSNAAEKQPHTSVHLLSLHVMQRGWVQARNTGLACICSPKGLQPSCRPGLTIHKSESQQLP